MFELDTIEMQLAGQDLLDPANIQQIADTLTVLFESYGASVKEIGLEACKENKKFVTKVNNKIAKVFKDKRDFYNKAAKNIIALEKQAREPLIELEEALKQEIEQEEARLLLEQRRLALPGRVQVLNSYGLDMDENYILQMNDIEFMTAVQDMLQTIAQEKKRQAEEDAKIKEAEERAAAKAKAEAEEAKASLEKIKQEQEVKAKQEAEEAEVRAKAETLIEAAKAEVGFNDQEFKVSQKGNTITIWKLVKTLELKG